MVAKTYGGAVHGVDARTIMVEVSVDQGLRFYMSGLPDNAIKESQHRVVSAFGGNLARAGRHDLALRKFRFKYFARSII